MVRGSCLCGSVTYEATGPFSMMVNCHCSICRKQHGAAFATHLVAPLAGFRWLSGADGLLNFRSSERGMRSSCKTCGSPAPTLLTDAGMAFLPAGPLEGELGITPQSHFFVGSKAPWYTITDNLPRHEEYPPGFGSPVETRPVPSARPGVTVGSCSCGDNVFEVEGEALFMQSCHCTRCRQARGAAHGTNIFYKASQLRWTRGGDRLTEYKVPEARFHTVAFCSRCGGALPKISLERDFAIVPAGCLDTDPPMRPRRHIFTSYKAKWFDITDDLPQFPEGPPPPPSR